MIPLHTYSSHVRCDRSYNPHGIDEELRVTEVKKKKLAKSRYQFSELLQDIASLIPPCGLSSRSVHRQMLWGI